MNASMVSGDHVDLSLDSEWSSVTLVRRNDGATFAGGHTFDMTMCCRGGSGYA
jgi:hypothetical protein